MTCRMPTYVEVIGESFPSCSVRAIGLGDNYNDLIYVSGDSIPSKVTLDLLILEKVKELKKEKVNDYRDEYLFDRFIYDGKRWDCDSTSRSNISGTITLGMLNGQQLIPGMTWRDYDNQNWPVDYIYLVNMVLTLAAFTNSVYNASWQHKATIDALGSIQAVIDYEYDTGWPSKDL